MNSIFRPSEISAISTPVTSSNRRNAEKHPAVDLGCATPFQLFASASISRNGTICILGKPGRGVGIARALTVRSEKPFLFLGTVRDKDYISSSLKPEWIRDSAQPNLPCGSGTILFANPHNAYLEICQYVEEWSKNYFLIIHLGNGLQAGTELMNIFCAIEQCLIFCDSIPQSIRNTDTRSITQLDFLQQMHYLLVFSSGAETESLVNLLPTYQYEKISNTTNLNTYRGRSILHPFHGHHGHGISVGQTRTMEYKKNIFEADELQRIFSDGYALVYNTILNSVYLVRII